MDIIHFSSQISKNDAPSKDVLESSCDLSQRKLKVKK